MLNPVILSLIHSFTHSLNDLRRLAEVLVGPEVPHGQLFRTAEELYRLFSAISGFDPESPGARLDLGLAQGKAIGPAWAAQCVLDFLRTRKFLRGIQQAIRTLRKRFPHARLHAVYAGPGPFATLVIPLLPLLEDENIEFTFLEISPASIQTLEKLIGALGLERFVRGIHPVDASTYRADHPVHLVVVEVMQAALRQEPQVAATLNLAPQILAGGFLIPQQITVHAGLLHPARNYARMFSMEGNTEEVYRYQAPVFDLSQDRVYPPLQPDRPYCFPEVEVAFPGDAGPGFSDLALFTEIRVFEDEVLNIWESWLTQPEVLLRLQGEKRFGFRYGMGEAPGFGWQVVE